MICGVLLDFYPKWLRLKLQCGAFCAKALSNSSNASRVPGSWLLPCMMHGRRLFQGPSMTGAAKVKELSKLTPPGSCFSSPPNPWALGSHRPQTFKCLKSHYRKNMEFKNWKCSWCVWILLFISKPLWSDSVYAEQAKNEGGERECVREHFGNLRWCCKTVTEWGWTC